MNKNDYLKKFELGNEYLLKKVPDFLTKELGYSSGEFKVLCWMPVLQIEWELDAWATVLELKDGSKIMIHTNHDNLIKIEDPKSFIQENIGLYEASLEKSKEALKLF